MNPEAVATIPFPDPLPVPAPYGLLWFLLLLTFFLHLVPMNFLFGGSIIAITARLRGGGGSSPHALELSRWFARATPVLVAATITTGVAPLLFVQVLYGRLFFVSSILMAWFWFAVVPLLIVAYYCAYILAFRREGGRGLVPAFVMTAIFFTIGYFYTNNMTFMLRPDTFRDRYLADGGGFWLNSADPAFIPRFFHNFLGAMAVSGMVVAVLGLIRRARQPEFGKWAMRHGSLWFAIPTVLNMIFGLWWLVALPREVMMRFMGQNMLASASLGLGILLALGTLVMMLLAANAPEPAGLIKGSIGSLVLTLVFMILLRDQVRQGMLESAGFEPSPWVATQWGPLLIFVVLLVAALGTVAWMVRKLATAPEGPREA